MLTTIRPSIADYFCQVMEATVCMFQEKLVNKRVVFGNSSTTGTVQIVSGDVQCRSCIDIKKQNEASDLELALKGLGCMAEIDNCRYKVIG